MNRRYFAYIRVSTVRQGERGSSLTEQKDAIEGYAARHGLTVAGWFEEMETAAKQGRRAFTRMLGQLRAGKADGIIIHKIDRSARNLKDWADLGDLIDSGKDIRFVSDNFDLSSRGGRLSADIQAVVASDYIRNLREEVIKGLTGRLKQGFYPFAAPCGYLDGGKGVLKSIDPIKGPLIRHMFERYASNAVSFETLRQELFVMGLRRDNGGPLHVRTLSRILNNPFYMGVMRVHRSGDTFPGRHEPLISKDLFERVQAILRDRTTPKAKVHTFLLRQFVRCGNCGRRTLTGEWQKGVVYYRCHGHHCRGVSWRADALEKVICAQLTRIRVDNWGRGDIGDVIRDAAAAQETDLQKYRRSLELKLKKIDTRLARLTDLVVDEAIDTTTFKARKEMLLKERQGVLDAILRQTAKSPLQNTLEGFERNNNLILRYETMDDPEKRELLENLGSNLEANEKNAVFRLYSPYAEIARLDFPMRCGLHRNDVRTFRVMEILERHAASTLGSDNGSADTSLTSPTSLLRRAA
jgi:DNA invertase Pin-like site-specific DNA recombinase